MNSLRFSPDGRWVASAGEDSTIKIWDLAAGKLLIDLKQHAGAVNSIEFHPSEYLLASGSSDRLVAALHLLYSVDITIGQLYCKLMGSNLTNDWEGFLLVSNI